MAVQSQLDNGAVTSTVNWNVANGANLQATIRITDCEQNEVELLDMISAETCVLLRLSNTDSDELLRSPLTLTIEVSQTAAFRISALSIICEARHLEIYNRLEQYITTVRTKLLDKVNDDFVAYESEVGFDSPVDYVTIKFLSLRSRNEMWLYGINLGTVKVDKDFSSVSTPLEVDIGTRIAKLEHEGVLLSENAKRFASLLQAGSHRDTNLASATKFMAMLAAKAQQVPRMRDEGVQNQSSHKEINVSNFSYNLEQGSLHAIEAKMVAHLKTSLDNLEHRLWSRIEARLASFEERQEARFNTILQAFETKLKTRDEKEPSKIENTNNKVPL